MKADAVVIGLGAAGSFAAYELAARGREVIGLERGALLHDNGAYAGESRLFRAAYHEGTEYLPMLLDSRRRWLATQDSGSRPLFLPTGVLSIGEPQAPQLDNVRRSLTDADLPHELLEPGQLRDRFPQHADIQDEVGVLDKLGGVLRPEAAVAEVQRQATAKGAELHGDTDVHAITETSTGVALATSAGSIAAAQVIVIAGVWTTQLLPQLREKLTIKPIALTWYAPNDPRQFEPEVFPGFVRDRGTTHIFGAPTIDGALVKAGFAAAWGDIDAPESLRRRLTGRQLERVSAQVRPLLHSLAPGTPRQSVHMDVFTADKRPLIGKLGARVTVATGFSGHGFKLSPALGNAAASLAAEDAPPYDLTPFDPARSP